MADLYYIDDDYYTPDGYFVYTADAVAIPTVDQATFTLDCVADKVKDVTVLLESTASQTALVGKITDNSITITGAFSPVITVGILKNSFAVLDSVATMSVTGVIVGKVDVTLSTIVNLSLQADVLQLASATLTSTVSQSVTATEYESYISTSPTPFYATGQALINTSQTHFGSHSLFLPDSTSGAYTATAHSKFNIPSAASATQSIGEEGRFSIAFWYYPTANTSGTFDDIVSAYDNSTDEGWFVQRSGSRDIRFRISDGTTGETTTATLVLTLNDWNWVVVTRAWTSGNRGELRIAVNGTVDVTDLSNDYSSGTSNKTLYIGDNGSGNGSAVGYIDGLHIEIGVDTSTSTVPTADTTVPTAYTKLLMNWNGSWYDQSQAVVESGAAALTSAATLSAVAIRATALTAALTSTASLSASTVKIKQLAATLTCQGFILAEGLVTTNEAYLTATSTLSATIDDPYLQLIYGAGNTSGFITSTGGTVVTKNTVDNSDAPEQIDYWLSTGAHVNFWIKLDTELTSGSSVRVYTSTDGGNYINLENASGTYQLVVQSPSFDYWWKPGFTDYVKYRRTAAITVPIGDWNTIREWVNVNGRLAPGIVQSWTSTGGDAPYPEYAFDITPQWGQWQINGSEVTETRTSTSTQLGPTANGNDYTAPAYTTSSLGVVDGGKWGANTNSVSLILDQVWVKNLGAPNSTQPPATEFYNAGYQTFIAQGLTPGNYQADVWLPWRTLLDKATPSPTWDYTATNRVLYGYIKDGSAQLTSQATQSTVARKIVGASATLTTTFTQSTSAIRQFGPITPIIAASFTQTTNAVKTARVSRALTSTATTTAQAQRVLVSQAALTSVASLTATAKRFRGITDTLTAVATQTATILRIKTSAVATEAIFTELTAAAKTGRTLVSIATTASLTVDAVKTTVVPIFLNSTASVSAAFLKQPQPREYSAALVAQATTVAAPIAFSGSLNNQMPVVVTMTTQARVDFVNGAVLTSQAEIVANAVAGKLAIVNATSTSTMTVNTLNSRIRPGSSAMSALDFLIAIGTKVTLDPYYQLVVQRETNIKKISQETAILTVDSESRVNTVLIDTTTIIVPTETSIWRIPFSPTVGSRRVQ